MAPRHPARTRVWASSGGPAGARSERRPGRGPVGRQCGRGTRGRLLSRGGEGSARRSTAGPQEGKVPVGASGCPRPRQFCPGADQSPPCLRPSRPGYQGFQMLSCLRPGEPKPRLGLRPRAPEGGRRCPRRMVQAAGRRKVERVSQGGASAPGDDPCLQVPLALLPADPGRVGAPEGLQRLRVPCLSSRKVSEGVQMRKRLWVGSLAPGLGTAAPWEALNYR